MKDFDLKFALKKRWPELAFALIWVLLGITNTDRAIDTREGLTWATVICDYLCAVCWVLIFYKRAKRDGA